MDIMTVNLHQKWMVVCLIWNHMMWNKNAVLKRTQSLYLMVFICVSLLCIFLFLSLSASVLVCLSFSLFLCARARSYECAFKNWKLRRLKRTFMRPRWILFLYIFAMCMRLNNTNSLVNCIFFIYQEGFLSFDLLKFVVCLNSCICWNLVIRNFTFVHTTWVIRLLVKTFLMNG